MAAATSEARELRSKAKSLGITDFANMTREDLRTAIETAESGNGNGKAPRKARAPRKAKTAEIVEDFEPEEEAPEPVTKTRKPRAKAATAKAAPEAPKRGRGRPPVDRSSIEPGTCPFRKGSDRATMFSLLKRGGVRRDLAEKLREKVTLRGEPGLSDYDKRIVLTADTLGKEWGYVVNKEGRGLEGKIKVVHSSAPAPAPRKARAAKG